MTINKRAIKVLEAKFVTNHRHVKNCAQIEAIIEPFPLSDFRDSNVTVNINNVH